MKFIGKFFGLTALVAACIFLFSPSASAYIDPTSGSYVIQLVLAAVIGGFFVIKQYFNRIRAFLKTFFKK